MIKPYFSAAFCDKSVELESMDKLERSIADEMEAYFGVDSKRIDHAHQVTGFVEQILEAEHGERSVVIAAGLLHDIGIHEAERKYASSSGKYQEIEGPPVAREILGKLSFDPVQIEEICQIIAHHHSPGKIESRNFKILYDADWLVNLKDEFDISDKGKLEKIINKVFLTSSGRRLAGKIYLNQPD
jgi:HD superfamily phosphodiesterase